MKIKLAVAVILLIAGCGCGYIGEPMPPLLNIPKKIEDVAVVERGSTVVVQFSVSQLSTEKVVLKHPVRVDLRAGEGKDPFHADEWAAGAMQLTGGRLADGRMRYEIPLPPAWVGREIIFAAKAIGSNGRDAGWSNYVVLPVVPPPAPPADVRAESVAQGVRLTWQGQGTRFRISRRMEAEKEFAVVAHTDRPEWVDPHTEYGKTYLYLVQALVKAGDKEAESDLSAEIRIVPDDRFPPAVPTGLTGVTSAGSIELAWDRNAEPDLGGYRVYRAAGGGGFELIGETKEIPSFSDRKIEPGKSYRYAVSSVDRAGNESARSEPVEVAAS